MTIITRKTVPFIAIIFFAFLVFIFSLWDILNHEQWLERIIALYGILILLTFLFLVSREKKKQMPYTPVNQFEQSLEGKLQHFKCPSCNGIFAIKKSKSNNKELFTLTCPNCGKTGSIPSTPIQIREDIPEKKSAHKNFHCQNCGECIMIWAEGVDILPDEKIHVYSCPYCGSQQALRLT